MASKNSDQGAVTEGTASSAIGKAFAVLQVLRHSAGSMTLTAIAEEIGVAPSSAHSILGHLLGEGAVVQVHDKRYQLGPQLFYLGSAFARNTPIYRSTWMELVNAAQELGVTASVAVPWNRHHLVLNSYRGGASNVAIPFGGRIPLDASSWGQVYYAWSGDDLPAELGSYTKRSITDLGAFKEELEVTRRNGYATDEGEFYEGVGGVCAPVTSVSGFEGLATFIAPLDRVDEIGLVNLGHKLALLTARASMALGDSERIRFFGEE
ncbi:IclR family transcriptional regulator [Rhodococcus sp. NPDC059968]|uniref:IclR family transcriptional regulator n=1 Tax=Rhodococcus sp. NPDC059968 TaxID=3347017 RepID=UPI0036704F41